MRQLNKTLSASIAFMRFRSGMMYINVLRQARFVRKTFTAVFALIRLNLRMCFNMHVQVASCRETFPALIALVRLKPCMCQTVPLQLPALRKASAANVASVRFNYSMRLNVLI